jgi:hypothetical protein
MWSKLTKQITFAFALLWATIALAAPISPDDAA